MLRRLIGCHSQARVVPWSFRRRFVFIDTQSWEEWKDDTPFSIEKFWASRLKQMDDSLNHPKQSEERKTKSYVLSMFPYPSGRLHLGHLRVYTVTDVLARWQRLRGKFVVHPMGWDAFGLPAENAALERGLAPRSWTKDNIAAMKEQLQSMGLSLDWSREIATCDPAYYRWTQWLFLRLHEHGLTYRKRELVNWDPVDRTVLADELVDAEGRSWRSGALVEKRKLRQWFFRATNYSKSLLEGLGTIEGNQWRAVIKLQRGWIGKLNGTIIEFDVKDLESDAVLEDRLFVFTKCPEAIYGVSHIVINSENSLADAAERSSKAFNGLRRLSLAAIHPLTGRSLPLVYNADLSFREEEARDAKLGIPSLHEEDSEVADWLQSPYPNIFDVSDHLINSDQLNGLTRAKAKEKVMGMLRKLGRGGFPYSALRTDWLISRQRYWGTPIPIIYCDTCGTVPVPDSELPVLLPTGSADTGKNIGPLSHFPEWLHTNCPSCGGPAQRESDTMDTFVDSSWYFLRFLDPNNKKTPCGRDKAETLMPVDIYVGGIEHATRHLYYARFIAHFLHDIGLLTSKEPFLRFLPVGLVMGKTFRVTKTGKYLNEAAVTRNSDNTVVETATNLPVTEYWDKMSKSKHNGTDPVEVIDRLGIETTRLCMLANTGPHKQRNWQEDEVVTGVLNWQRRVWSLVGEFVQATEMHGPLAPFGDQDPLAADMKFLRERLRCLESVAFCYEESFVISVAVARLQQLTGLLTKVPLETRLTSASYAQALCDLVVHLSPLAPMFSCELWSALQWALSGQEHNSISYDMTRPVLLQNVKDLRWSSQTF